MRKMRRKQGIKIEKGSGNVYADLGLAESDELFTRAQIGFHVVKILNEQKLKQRQIGGVLGIEQPEVSHLMNGHFSRFSAEKLLAFLHKLEIKVTIYISLRKKGEPYQQVSFVSSKPTGKNQSSPGI
jgi:predicted XRE-type DNA-binding protein